MTTPEGTGHEDPPEEPTLFGKVVIRCEHLPPDVTMMILPADMMCAQCVLDALTEAEGLLEE